MKLNQYGAVSLLSSAIFATIITILITAYMMMAIAQQRQSITNDFSTRAYYTAESGVQDAIRELNNGAAVGGDDCKPIGKNSGVIGIKDANLVYTCQLVISGNKGAPGIVHDASVNQVVAMRLNPKDRGVDGPYRLVLYWSPSSTKSNLYARSDPVYTLPTIPSWYQGGALDKPLHSMMRVSVIDHPTANFTSDDIRQRVTFLNPTSGNDSSVGNEPDEGKVLFGSGDSLEQQQINLINNADCYDYTQADIPASHMVFGAGSYLCRRTIELGSGYSFDGQEIYVRVAALYRDTQFYLELQNDAGDPIALDNAQVTIDVTGRAGDNVFRRVRQVISSDADITVDQSGPDAAVVIAEGICKHFAVGTNPSQFVPGCNPLD